MSYWRNISPRGAIADLVELWRQPTPHRWPILAVSVLATTAMFIGFIPKSERVEPRPPEIIYISTFEPGRTDEEIVASNLANQERQDALRAEAAAREERRKEAFRALGRATGLDVEALERQYSDEPATPERDSPSE